MINTSSESEISEQKEMSNMSRSDTIKVRSLKRRKPSGTYRTVKGPAHKRPLWFWNRWVIKRFRHLKAWARLKWALFRSTEEDKEIAESIYEARLKLISEGF